MRRTLQLIGFVLTLLVLMAAVNVLDRNHYLLSAVCLGLGGAIGLAIGYQYVLWQPFTQQLKALSSLVAAWRDQDFSTSIAKPENGRLNELTQTLNSLGDTLRSERVNLVQRELMLDTLIQNTPTALVLVAMNQRVVVCNLAARELCNAGKRFEGEAWDAVIARLPEALREALTSGHEGLVTLEQAGADAGSEEIFHLSQRQFTLQARPHRLILLRRMTTELARQEVATWKKVIRVISHELNNSLAPISSMAHSGAVLLARGQLEPLTKVFATISERSTHLAQFIASYARVAKLPLPQRSAVHWPSLLERVIATSNAGVIVSCPDAYGDIDVVQIEQLLINLLKNAVEAGSDPKQIKLSVCASSIGAQSGFNLEVADRGSGMSDLVMASALLPFYSTKRTPNDGSGSGLGLALAREIAEAHGGRISLSNREGGGLLVRVFLPGTQVLV